jgi:hypothetical protein
MELVKPVRRVEPQLTARQGTEPLEASIEVQVDQGGGVKSARLIDLDHAPSNIEWLSLRAAKDWRFETPKEGQSSSLVLTFRYEPEPRNRSE